MDLRVLKYFLVVAREENITKAAELLHVSQPAISRQIAQLEEELGIQAFKRSNHHITLTEDGMLLKRRAQEMIDLAEKTRQDFAQKKEEIAGEIAIGSGELFSVRALGKMLADFQALHPKVRYHLFSGNADHIKERIESGTLDLGLLSLPVDVAKYDFLRFPMREEWGALVRQDDPLAQKSFAQPEDLQNTPILLAERAPVQHELANWFGALYDRLNVVVTFNLLYNAAMLVRNGMGAALCLRLDCHYDGLTFVPLSPPLASGSVLVWKKHQTHAPAVLALLAHIEKSLRAPAQ